MQGHKVGTLKLSFHALHLCLKRDCKKFEQISLFFFFFSPSSGFFCLQLTEYDAQSYNFQQIHQRYKPFETGLLWGLGSGQWLHFQCQHLCEWRGYNTHLLLQLYNTGLWPVQSPNGISQPWAIECNSCLLPFLTTPSPAKPFWNLSVFRVTGWTT